MSMIPGPLGLPAGPLNIGTITYGPRALTAAERIAQALDAASLTSGAGAGGGGAGTATRAAAQARLAQAAAGTQGAAPIAAPGASAGRAAQAAAQRVISAPSFVGRAGAATTGIPGSGAAGGLAGAVGARGASAAGGGRLAGLLGLGGRGAGAGAAAGRTGLLASLGKGGALRSAGLYALGGQAAGMGVESLTGHREGTWDDALRNAAVGAGIGAGVGSVVPIVGTGVGAGIGGLVGGAYGALTGKGSDEGEAAKAYDKQTARFENTFDRYMVSPDLREQFMMQFQLATDGLKRGEVNEVAKQMQTMLPQLIIEDEAIQEEERGRTAMLAAAQAWMAPMMQDAMGRTTTYGDQLSQSMLSSAEHIKDPASRAFAVEDARRIPLDIASQQAYSMQMMMSLPGLYGYQTQQGEGGVPAMDFNSIMNATPIAGAGGMGGGVPVMPGVMSGAQPMQSAPAMSGNLNPSLFAGR